MQKAANTQEEPEGTHRTVRFAWTRPLQRAVLSVFGSFSVAVAVTAALNLVIVNESWDQPASAFYWASYEEVDKAETVVERPPGRPPGRPDLRLVEAFGTKELSTLSRTPITDAC